MPIQFRCICGQMLQADEFQQGQAVNCPNCGTMLNIPVLGQQPPQPYAPPGAQPGYAAPPQAWPGAQAPFGPPGYPQQQFAPPGYPQQPGGFPAGIPGGSPMSAPQSNFTQPGPAFAAPQPEPFAQPESPGYASSAPEFPFLGSAPGTVDTGALGEVMRPPGDWEEEDGLESAMVQLWHIPCPKGHILETPDEMLDEEVECPYCQTQFVLKHFNSIEATEKRELERELKDARSGEIWLKLSIGIAVVVVLGLIVLIAIR